jgi:hypothetical protein
MVINIESVQVLPEQMLVMLQVPTMEELDPPALARDDSTLRRPARLIAATTRIRNRFFGINRTPTARDDNRRTKTFSRFSCTVRHRIWLDLSGHSGHHPATLGSPRHRKPDFA